MINSYINAFDKIAESIDSCYINIPELADQLYPGIVKADYMKIKEHPVEDILLEKGLFHKDELVILKRFKTFKRQIEWISGRIIIKFLVSGFHNSQIPLSTIRIDTEDKGSPYLPDYPELSISISHSNEYAIGCTNSSIGREIGIDIEMLNTIKNLDHFFRIGFTDDEAMFLRGKPVYDVYRIWTIKESFLKYIKMGFHQSLKSVNIIDNRIYFNNELMEHLNVYTGNIGNDYIVSFVYG